MERVIEPIVNKYIKQYSDKNIGDILKLLSEKHNIDLIENSEKKWIPKYDILNYKEYMLILLELPGVEKKRLSVEINNNKIIIKGDKQKPNKKYLVKNEIKYGKFERKIILPMNINDENDVKIEMKQGILSIRIDKKNIIDKTFTINF